MPTDTDWLVAYAASQATARFEAAIADARRQLSTRCSKLLVNQAGEPEAVGGILKLRRPSSFRRTRDIDFGEAPWCCRVDGSNDAIHIRFEMLPLLRP